MSQVFALVGFFEIVLVLFMHWEIYTQKIITTFSVASYVVAAFLLYLGVSKDLPYVVALSIITAVVRGFFIPWYMKRCIVRDQWREREIKPVISTAISIIISLLIVVFAYILYRVTFFNALHLREGSIPMALLLQGAFLIISRRNAFIQLIGYMTMENALFLFEGYLFPGLPFIIEAGVVLDLIGVIAIAGVVVRMMKDSSSDVNDFDELKG